MTVLRAWSEIYPTDLRRGPRDYDPMPWRRASGISLLVGQRSMNHPAPSISSIIIIRALCDDVPAPVAVARFTWDHFPLARVIIFFGGGGGWNFEPCNVWRPSPRPASGK